MLPALNIPSMLAMSAVVSITMALALSVVPSRRQEGMGLWSAALLFNALAFVLFAGRGAMPDWASVVAGNVLFCVAFALALAAVCQFQQRAIAWVHMAWPVLVAIPVFVALIHEVHLLPVAMGLLLSAQIYLLLGILWNHGKPPEGRGARLLMVALALQAVLLLLRAALAGLGVITDYTGNAHGHTEPPFILAALIITILASLGFILMARDRADAQIRHQAAHDALTGIPNRRALIQALNRDVARAIRTHESYALLMLDIDHFKRINDDLGHLAGDRVLCHVSKVLRARLRSQDLVGRYGGEEFLALLPDTSLRGALELAELLREAVAQTPFLHQGRAIQINISIGVFGDRLEPGDGWDMLIHCADQALYTAKAAGRNCVEFSTLLRESHQTMPDALV